MLKTQYLLIQLLLRLLSKKTRDVPLHLLNDPPVKSTEEDEEWLEEQQNLLEETLKHFQVKAKVVKATQGPAVTRFEVQPEMGVKVSKIKKIWQMI